MCPTPSGLDAAVGIRQSFVAITYTIADHDGAQLSTCVQCRVTPGKAMRSRRQAVAAGHRLSAFTVRMTGFPGLHLRPARPAAAAPPGRSDHTAATGHLRTGSHRETTVAEPPRGP